MAASKASLGIRPSPYGVIMSAAASNSTIGRRPRLGPPNSPSTPAVRPPVAAASLRIFPSRCHFETRSSDDEGDDEEHCEDKDEDGSRDEWVEDDEETPAVKPPSGKTEEEKLEEA
ncbi:hypothetical protein TRIUR3_31359 [Triticum urartu]|uniref:Uncharacterized protein n=1 Tax=Triticum urartu TaxID=4572 RepID=M7YN08_TRIUA|nr:hypothetical protein TRIUR3_31359 [Triticum urartu]